MVFFFCLFCIVELLGYCFRSRIINFWHFDTLLEEIRIPGMFFLFTIVNFAIISIIQNFKNLPNSFNNIFIANNQIHQYSTRNSLKFHKHCHRTNSTKFSAKGIDIWNSLDGGLTKITLLSTFKKKSKIYFMNNNY